MNWLLTVISDDSLLLLLGLTIFFKIFESILPARPVPKKHFYSGFIYGLSNVLFSMLLAPLLSLVTTFVIRKFGTGLIDLHVITSSDAMGAVFAVLLSTLVADFFLYWYHRLRHANRILWETHLVHHSDKHMNVTTYARGHFTELVLLPVVVTAPISFLFQLPPVSIAILSLIPRVWEYFTHANLKIGFGRLWWLAVSPDYHRIHHSIEKKHFDKNFATWFPLWDILFSTAWRPQSGERPATGVEGINANSVFELFTLPFVRWSKLSRKN